MTQGIFSLKDVKLKQIKNVNNNTFSYWPEEPLYGYVAGGNQNPGAVNQQVYKIDYSTEVVNTSTARTFGPSGIQGDATITNVQYGYFGNNNSSYLLRLDYASESFSLSVGGSTSPTAYYAETYENAVYSGSYGYFGGGTYGIKKFDMTTEIFSGAGSLNATRFNSAAQSSESGYFISGTTPAPTQQSTIYKIDFSSEQISTLSNGFSTQFIYANGSVSSSNFGYVAGGYQQIGGTTYSFINRLDFSTELSSNTGKNLPSNTFYNSGCDNRTYGYFIGGYNPSPPATALNTISRIDFNTEVISTPGKNLPSPLYLNAAQSGGASVNPNFTSYGYFVGGTSTPLALNTIMRMDFDTESVSSSPTYLPVGLHRSSSVYDDNIGYVIGGNLGPTPNQASSAIYRIALIDGTISLSSPMGIPQGRYDLQAVQSSLYGYFVGGDDPSGPDPGTYCNIYRLDLSNNTVSSPGRKTFKRLLNAASVSSSNYGYFYGGGANPNPPTPYCNITRLDFNTDVVSEPGQNAPSGRFNSSFAQSNTHGYFVGGGGGIFTSPFSAGSSILKLDFSSETVTLSPKVLPQNNSSSASIQSPNYAYFGGGYSSTDIINRLDFSSDTVSSPGYKQIVNTTEHIGLSSKYTGGGPYTPYSSTYGYFTANDVSSPSPGVISEIFRLDLTTEVVSQPTNGLSPERNKATGTQSNTFGYVLGGMTFPNSPVGSSNKLEFSTETITALPSLLLSPGRSMSASVQNATYGYIAGGYGPGPIGVINTILRIQFSNDTQNLPGQNLQFARYLSQGVEDNAYGFFIGANPAINTITRLNFSTEVVSDPGKNLPVALANHYTIENNTFGYVLGGYTSPTVPSSSIFKLDFSNETVSLSPKTLSAGPLAAPAGGGSIKSTNYGYFGGGYYYSNDIRRLEFSTDTVISQVKKLPKGINGSAGVYD